ncbi:hypothetical protein ACIPUC_01550 [Streptomyces sp. LARHCF249]
MRDQPKVFARACLVVGAGLLAWALIGAVIGMFLFIPAALQRKEQLRDFGATRISVAEHRPGQLVLTVGIPDSFAEGHSQDRLKEQILRLPGVVDLRFCTFHTCD